ncbi:MAG: FliG C-terminal domain-containing protein, partial [Serratia nevei]
MDVEDRGIQMLLREVPNDVLQRALKGADEHLREKVYRNMSKRAVEMLREDLEAMGPVRVADVEAAQKEVLAIIRRMADAGEIVINSPGSGDQFI